MHLVHIRKNDTIWNEDLWGRATKGGVESLIIDKDRLYNLNKYEFGENLSTLKGELITNGKHAETIHLTFLTQMSSKDQTKMVD